MGAESSKSTDAESLATSQNPDQKAGQSACPVVDDQPIYNVYNQRIDAS